MYQYFIIYPYFIIAFFIILGAAAIYSIRNENDENIWCHPIHAKSNF